MRMPVIGPAPGANCPSAQAGSRRIISRCSERSAIANGVERAAAEIEIRLFANPGNIAQNACAVMPPSEGPITPARVSRPMLRSSLIAAVGDVLDGEHRKAQAVRLPGCRIDRCGPGRTETASERVHTDDEPAAAVERTAGTDHVFPPSGGGILVRRRRVRRRRQTREDEQAIVACRVELAPGLVGDLRFRQRAARPHRERLLQPGNATARSCGVTFSRFDGVCAVAVASGRCAVPRRDSRRSEIRRAPVCPAGRRSCETR